jgi:type VI secretion system secreted protein VgrG
MVNLAPPRRTHRLALFASAGVGSCVVLATLIALPSGAGAAAAGGPDLGTADTYSVLAASTVTNTGLSILSDNVGVSPGTAVTGFPPGIYGGVKHAADAQALQAKSDLLTAYNDAAGRSATGLASVDLVGLTLVPGVYKAPGQLKLTGNVTLDAQGNQDAVFIFQAASTLITSSATHVIMKNGAQPCNVWWQVGSSATLGSASFFKGTIMAHASVTVNNAVQVEGRAMANTAAVTLINDRFITPGCATGLVPSSGGSSSTGSTTGATGSGSTGTVTGTGTGTGTNTAGTGIGTGTGTGTATGRTLQIASSPPATPSTSAFTQTGSPSPTPSRTTTITTLSRTGLSSLVRQLLLVTPLLLILGGILMALGRRRTAARHRS